MSVVVAALVRIVVYAAALVGYYATLPYLFPDDGGGANIGAGLLAFAALMAISFGWATVDGHGHGIASALLIWAIVAAVVSVGCLIALAVREADSSMSVAELIRADFDIMPFIAGLILAPAVVGAAVGHALRPSQVQ